MSGQSFACGILAYLAADVHRNLLQKKVFVQILLGFSVKRFSERNFFPKNIQSLLNSFQCFHQQQPYIFFSVVSRFLQYRDHF